MFLVEKEMLTVTRLFDELTSDAKRSASKNFVEDDVRIKSW